MGAALTLAVVQRAFGDDRAANCEAVTEDVGAAVAAGADVVLCPELFEGRYFPQHEEQDYFAWATTLDDNPAVAAMRKVTAGTGAVGVVVIAWGRAAVIIERSQAWLTTHAAVLRVWLAIGLGAALIADVVNRKRPGTAELRVLPNTDHHFTRFGNRRDAFKDQSGTEAAAPAVDAILAWLRARGMTPAAAN